MEHNGGCHCGALRVTVRLSKPPLENLLRSCSCSFCRRTRQGPCRIRPGCSRFGRSDWSQVEHYRFGSRTADYLVCRRCGVYIGAVCETAAGTRAVVNTNCLDDRAAFAQDPVRPDYDGEATEARLARRAANWMPAVLHQ